MKTITALASIAGLSLLVSAHAIACTPTPHRTTGTHYKPVTRQAGDIGKGLIVTGRVLAMPDCKPVANARVAHWQAGENGRYSDRLRAWLVTDKNGYFRFETEWPNMFSPHIHFIVTARGYRKLDTQWIGRKRRSQIRFDMVLVKQ